MIGIYKITSPSGRIYIGQSVDIERRLRRYKIMSVKTKGQTKIWRSLEKYGAENHTYEAIISCKENDLNKYERISQEYYDSVDNGLNCFYTKEGDKSGRASKDTLKRMSEAQKGNNNWLGKKHSQESKDKISKAHLGMRYSDEVNKKKSSRGTFGNGRESWVKGKFGKDHPRAKAILQFSKDGEFLREWSSGVEITNELGFNNANICSCCNGSLKSSSGYVWKYKE
jgi:group I intron endonuclease